MSELRLPPSGSSLRSEPPPPQSAGEEKSDAHYSSPACGGGGFERSEKPEGGSRVDIVTFGCRLNAYESEVARAEAEAAGLHDAIIVNTCAVTSEAVRQARQSIRRLKKERPGAHIIVTGCAAQIEPTKFAEMPEVELVLGNEEKLKRESYTALSHDDAEKIRVNDIMSVRETAGHLIDSFNGRARAFVQVQNGCDHRCTFCIIPYGRGNSRSVPAGIIVEQVKRLVGNGVGEIVLTGVDITSYGSDLFGRPTLGRLVHQILKLAPDLRRLRLSSIDSIEVDEPLLEAITCESRVMPHLHLSLQSGDDLILKRMKRRHLREHSIAFCQAMRAARPEIAFGADFIAGFPTETEAMFENTLKLVDECGLSFLHVFPFSPRPNTPASRMPQLPRHTIRDRAQILRAKGDKRLASHLAHQVGRDVEVLIESGTDGHAADFSSVRLTKPMGTGMIVSARVIDAQPGRLVANPI